MCGIVGFWGNDSLADSHTIHILSRNMADAISHRGPDADGYWSDPQSNIMLAHRRLSILDLSSAGSQPMTSPSGRYVITYNGEIYNHLTLRKKLEETGHAPAWRGHSDTETLLAACDIWGIEQAIKNSVGMFAFALWDKKESVLTLVRDRLGEKPLYYGWQGDIFLFGSELKSLKAHPVFKAKVDRNALTLLLRHNCIPAPHSIYKGIKKLLPGTFLQLSKTDNQFQVGILPKPQTYWSLYDSVGQGIDKPFIGSDLEAIETLDGLLHNSVRQQMISDVPLGAFLSGGIDSSTIVALMQAQSDLPINSFTIGFNEEGYNEAVHAKAVAKHLGTNHTELYISPQKAIDIIPRLSELYDEPFSDASQIPTFLVSQMTQQHVTVSLSGDGGDELFGGYNRYFWANKVWKKMDVFPLPMRKALAQLMLSLSPEKWNSLFYKLSKILPENLNISQPGDKAHKLAEIMTANTPEEIYWRLVSHWKHPSEIIIGTTEPHTILTEPSIWPKLPDFEHRMMYLDTMSYLPDDILTKVDRAAMGTSLETRIPFLDHNIVEFSWRLPLSAKIREGQGKWILRQVLNKYVPKELIERPKMGFSIPIDSWLRKPLRDWAEDLLDENRLRQEGYFNPEPIRKKWEEHLSGKRNWQYYLWNILMFQAWLEKNQ